MEHIQQPDYKGPRFVNTPFSLLKERYVPEDQWKTIWNLVVPLINAVPDNIDVEKLLDALIALPSNQRKSIATFAETYREIDPDIDIIEFLQKVNAHKWIPFEWDLVLPLLHVASDNLGVEKLLERLIPLSEKERSYICSFAVRLFTPGMDMLKLLDALIKLPDDQRESIATFAETYREAHPDLDILNFLEEAKTPENQSLEWKKEFLPLVALKERKNIVAEIKPEEVDAALHQEFTFRVTDDTRTLEELLKIGLVDLIQGEVVETSAVEHRSSVLSQLQKTIEKELKENGESKRYDLLKEELNELNKELSRLQKTSSEVTKKHTYSAEGLKYATEFLDSIPFLTLSLAAKDSNLQDPLLAYLPIMQRRHLAVVLPFIPLNKLLNKIQKLEEDGFDVDLINEFMTNIK